ncbi:MAG: YicC family protein [Lentimicrobiaceae bacterium]|nr:YicC family protein [Lentimicrobiaceae bacterium]
MIKSMTGYGKSRKESEGRIFQAEARSVNSKTLDLTVKLPAEYRELETDLRTKVAAVLGRGKVELVVSVTHSGSEAGKNLLSLNTAQIENYRKELQRLGMESSADALLHLPGVVLEAMPEEVSEAEKEMLLLVTDECLEILDRCRIQEGAALKQDLELRVSNIEELLRQTDAFEQERVPAIRARIEQHLAEWNREGVDANRLEQEMIYYLEKLDVTEEKVRLAGHCRYYRESLQEDAAGRKLGFIAQEMGREINTLGSKANHAEMQKTVVRMKDELEKIKEQLFNIL